MIDEAPYEVVADPPAYVNLADLLTEQAAAQPDAEAWCSRFPSGAP